MNNKVWLVGFLLTTFGVGAQAQEIRVRKTIGQKAIVQFPMGIVPQVGQVYTLATDSNAPSASPPVIASAGSRDNFIGLSNSLPFAMGGGGVSLVTSVQYGWNLGGFEIAPNLGLSKSTVGDVSVFGFNVGILADINFVSNAIGESFVPAFTINAGFAKGGTISFGGGFAGKLYVLGESQSAIRLALRFDGAKAPASLGGGLSKSIQILEVGIQTYF